MTDYLKSIDNINYIKSSVLVKYIIIYVFHSLIKQS